MTDYETIRKTLLSQRYGANEIPPDAPGIYALFLTDRTALANLTVGLEVLYLGMTQSSLEVRNHFGHPNSGFSSPRRSLGALLKEELHLQAIPRAPGSSCTNMTSFRFLSDGEKRLTAWMHNHLTYGFCRVEKDVREVECRLIKDLTPPLNLTGWRNPQGSQLRRLLRACRDEACDGVRRNKTDRDVIL